MVYVAQLWKTTSLEEDIRNLRRDEYSNGARRLGLRWGDME